MDMRFDASVAPMTNPGGVELRELDPSSLSGARMKGFALLHLLELMDREDPAHGDTWRALWPAPHRERLARDTLRASTWLPVEYYFHGVGWLAKRRGGLREAIAIGHASTTADISAFFRFVASMASTATVLALAQRFWGSYFDRSTLHVTTVGTTSAVVEVRDWPLPHDAVSLHEVAGAFLAFSDASRAQDLRVTRVELTRPGLFTYAVTWR